MWAATLKRQGHFKLQNIGILCNVLWYRNHQRPWKRESCQHLPPKEWCFRCTLQTHPLTRQYDCKVCDVSVIVVKIVFHVCLSFFHCEVASEKETKVILFQNKRHLKQFWKVVVSYDVFCLFVVFLYHQWKHNGIILDSLQQHNYIHCDLMMLRIH